MRSKIINSSIKVDDIIIPIEVFREFRLDVRTALKYDKVIIRLPLYYGNAEIKKTLRHAEDWIKAHFNKNTALKNRFILKEYKSGDELHINGLKFILDIQELKVNKYRAHLENNIIRIIVPEEADIHERKETLVYLQSKITGQYFLPEIKKRIDVLNKKYFNVKVNEVRIKYNKTNWGSRSAKSNINISTRLLFAPAEVQDYVFIHELAHFIEMNHSQRFWDIVRSIIPDYKEKEKWLRLNSSKCDF